MKPDPMATAGEPSRPSGKATEGLRPTDSSAPIPAGPSPLKRWLWLMALGVAGLTLTFGAFAGYSVYKDWRLRRLTIAASESMVRMDFEGASLSARRALQLDADYLPACKLLAEIGERGGDPRALTWRRRVVELAPGSVRELLSYASAALRFDRRAVAVEVLENVAKEDRGRADYQAVAGAVALSGGDRVEAERYLKEAVRLAPENTAYRLELAILQSQSADFFTRETGRQALTEMREDRQMEIRALRGLVVSYEGAGENAAALRASRQLLDVGAHTFADELTHLTFLKRVSPLELPEALEKVEVQAARDPRLAATLLAWMNTQGMAAEAVEWATQRVPAIGKMATLAPMLAGSYAAIRDWPALMAITQGDPWPGLEHVRQAYRSRALREGGQIPLAISAWKSAISSALAEKEGLTWLAQTAAAWNWLDENEMALLALVAESKSREPVDILAIRYLADGNTAGLRRLASSLMEADDSDDDAKNDYAILSFLLHTDVERALRIAQDLYQRNPTNPGYLSTHAFGLYYAGQTKEAVRLMETLPAAKLEEPAFAAYYGLFLEGSGAGEKGTRYLQIAREGKLLKEERELVEESLKMAQSGRPLPK